MSLCLRTLRIVVPLCAAVAFSGLAAAQQPAQSQPAQAPPPAAKPPAPAAPPVSAQKPAPPQVSAPATKDPVVATVNGQPIYLSELEIAQQALPPQYRTMPLASVFPALLDRIADSKLVVGDAKKSKIEADPTFKRRMAFVEDQVIQDYWLQREIAKRITPEKMQQRFQEKLKSMPPEEEVHARHILVATEAEAKDLLAELKKGTPIEKLAKEKSTDKASGAEGGDLGWFKRNDMVKEFSDAAFALKKGELSETPIKTQFGYHIIKVEDRRQAPPPAFEEMAEQIREDLARETVTAFIDQLRAGAKIEKFNIDGSKPDPAAAKPAGPAAPAPTAPPK
ncbi:peptidylprolyl isomerase [Reyranella sp.]|uniref:peptidylprolyl isomerase n=1 Tax=Reyranella sp. TaxID=1929291 RepID=UPI003D0CBD5B